MTMTYSKFYSIGRKMKSWLVSTKNKSIVLKHITKQHFQNLCAYMYRGGALKWTVYMMLIGHAIYTNLGVLVNVYMIGLVCP